VLKRERKVATKLTSKLQLFEAKLAAAQKKASSHVSGKKTKFEKVLKTEAAQIEGLRSDNTKLLEEIDVVRSSNTKQRRRAEELKLAATGLRAELQHMQSNITFMQQFMDESLTSSEESMKATKLNVLSELSDLEHTEKEQKDRKLRLLAITKHNKKTKSVMLQFPMSLDLNGKAQELLSSMSTGLDEFYTDQHEALETMEKSFLKDQATLNATRAELLKEKAELESIKATEDDLKIRLKAAVEILEKAKTTLSQKVNAVHGFSRKMGQKAVPVALLQDDAVRVPKKTLPTVYQVMNKSTETLNHMHSDTLSLTARVHESQKVATHKIAQQKAVYEKELTERSAQNDVLRLENSGIAKEIKFIHKQNVGFRRQAEELGEENHLLKSKLRLLQMNISTAEEFTSVALTDADARLNVTNIADLQVLAELDAEDASHAKNAAKEKEFTMVAEADSSLLELASSRAATHGKPQELLQSLLSSLENLGGLENESMSELKSNFNEQWQAGETEHEDLVEQHTLLNSTLANESAVNLRLRKAVSHLTKSNEELKTKSASVSSFVGTLATGKETSKVDLQMLRLKQRSKAARGKAAHTAHSKNHKSV